MHRQGPANGSPSCGLIPRFGRVSGYICMMDALRRLPYPQRIVYRIAALVRRCIEGLAPPYLREHCCPTVAIISLRSSATSPPNTDCYPTAPCLLCGWPDGLEWSPGCAASDTS